MTGHECPACTAMIFTSASEPRRTCPNCGASPQTQDIARQTRLMRNIKGEV
ncbi:hypothetical protein [Novosphingobium sp. KN65.2]|uniref:hypothetical protein n=1 Tax=Novosphingobium sp. KN65.2 TaxID=1478134 RepID=UPI0012E1AE4D|nr:hypothetical protein [Novosphingobium sp. KN65.2]